MWLVTASSITEPIAESASHCSCGFRRSFPLLSAATFSCENPFIDSHAVPAHSSAKPAKRNDQPQPRLFRSKAGSKSSGKPSSASSEAKLERANSRYGTTVRKRRQYHACRSGVVVESRKYGK